MPQKLNNLLILNYIYFFVVRFLTTITGKNIIVHNQVTQYIPVQYMHVLKCMTFPADQFALKLS